jgi:cobalamin biosynthesis Mg chelatase CobN
VNSISKALIAAALTATVFVVAHASPASAATPCWKRLLNDWYDGRIDNVYPISCYEQTLKHLPEDISVYSSAREDIQRALQSARAQLKKNQKPAGPSALVPAQTTATPTATTTAAPATTTPGGKKTTTTTPTASSGGTDSGGGTSSPGRKPPAGLPGVAQQLNPSSPSSLPVPLLVLGGLALLLVAAGGVGLVVKRTQGRRPGS